MQGEEKGGERGGQDGGEFPLIFFGGREEVESEEKKQDRVGRVEDEADEVKAQGVHSPDKIIRGIAQPHDGLVGSLERGGEHPMQLV